MDISANTKISELIKANPASIDAIVSINKHFEKLRNPILRKILASRVTIADAAKIGGCTVNDFFKKLAPLGFTVSTDATPKIDESGTLKEKPDFMKQISTKKIITLDVRPDIASGKDPFQRIMQKVSALSPDDVLLIINTFEPVPLINILKKKEFEHYTEIDADKVVHTYLKPGADKKITLSTEIDTPTIHEAKVFEEKLNHFTGRIKEIDVRDMEMPMPMMTILQELETLPEGMALFVHHKKVPQYLLPELKERNFSWLIKEVETGNVKLLIYR